MSANDIRPPADRDLDTTDASWDAPKLSVEMIPRPIFGENLRNRLSRAEWERCKNYAKAESGGVCGICGEVGARGRVECHERWQWNEASEPHVQKLIGLIALCPRCHGATHFGRALVIGFEQDALDQLMRVNAWSRAEAKLHISGAMERWTEQSEHEWELDLTWLAETLSIEPGEPRTLNSPWAVKPPQPPGTAIERLAQAQERLPDLQEQLKQANYRVRYAPFWATKITDTKAGEERLAAAKLEATYIRKQIASQKAVVLELQEEAAYERKAAAAAKRRARKPTTP